MIKIILILTFCFINTIQIISQWSTSCSSTNSWTGASQERHQPYLKLKGDYVYITGSSYNTINSTHAIRIMKYRTSDCGLEWAATYSSSDPLIANGIDVDNSGNVYVVGTEFNGTDNDYITLKYASSNGGLIWATPYDGGGNDEAGAIGVRDSSGTVFVYVTGGSYNSFVISGTLDIYTICYFSTNGGVRWSERFDKGGTWPNTNGDDKAWSIAIDDYDSGHPSYGIYVAGWYDNGNDCGGDCQRDAQLVHYQFHGGTHDGAVHYGDNGLGDDYNNAVAVSPVSHYVYTVGAKYPGDYYDFFTAGYKWSDDDPSVLDMIWCDRYNGPGEGEDIGKSLVVEPIDEEEDYVYATGFSLGSGTGIDYVTLKYHSYVPISWYGDLIWASRYNSSSSTNDLAYSIDLNSESVFITGSSGPQNSSSMASIQYSTIDGSEVCSPTIFNPTSNGEFGYSIAVDQDEIYIAGITDWNHGSYSGDFALLKYAECTSDGDRQITTTSKNYSLKQNYPNPFNPTTSISYYIPRSSSVSIEVFNTIGQLMLSTPFMFKEPGDHSEFIDGSNWASGIYFYKITAQDILNPGNTFTASQKMLLVK